MMSSRSLRPEGKPNGALAPAPRTSAVGRLITASLPLDPAGVAEQYAELGRPYAVHRVAPAVHSVRPPKLRVLLGDAGWVEWRSEEDTSELQSHHELVC